MEYPLSGIPTSPGAGVGKGHADVMMRAISRIRPGLVEILRELTISQHNSRTKANSHDASMSEGDLAQGSLS